MELSNYFTKAFDSKDWQTWVGVVIKAGTLGSATYFTWNRCANDLEDAKELHWNHHYGFMTEDVKVSPKVRAWTSEDTSWTIGMVVSLSLTALAIVYYALSKYYYLFFGMQIGYFISNLFVAIDYWGRFGIMKPEPAYERYLPADH